jgi:hypothetical protein
MTLIWVRKQRHNQCDQIGRNFAICLPFTGAFPIFNLNKQFQSMNCDTWFNIRKQFDATILLSFDYWAAVWASFPQIGRFFFKFLVTVHVLHVDGGQVSPPFEINVNYCKNRQEI